MEFNLNQIVEQMIEKGYMTVIKGKVKVTGKLDREYIPSTTLTTVKQELAVSSSSVVLTPEQLFMQYIKASEVPTRCPTAKYWLNRNNKEAAREFHRILTKENINLQVLVASTKLYYITTKEYAKTIGNYILEGIWRSGYEDMLASAEKGNVQKYISEEVKGDSNTLDL